MLTVGTVENEFEVEDRLYEGRNVLERKNGRNGGEER